MVIRNGIKDISIGLCKHSEKLEYLEIFRNCERNGRTLHIIAFSKSKSEKS